MADDSTFSGKMVNFISKLVFAPSEFVKEKIVEPIRRNRPRPKYYHRQFRRVPTVDECYTDDIVCFHEANEQYNRDRKVDDRIIEILRTRYLNCELYERDDARRKCQYLFDEYTTAETNWYIKHGELGATATVYTAFMKQKHRMVYERRHPEWKQW